MAHRDYFSVAPSLLQLGLSTFPEMAGPRPANAALPLPELSFCQCSAQPSPARRQGALGWSQAAAPARKARTKLLCKPEHIERLQRELRQCRERADEVVVQAGRKRKPRRALGPEQYDGRGTDFIGVSKNGRKWQALIMIGLKKRYLGTHFDPRESACEYDKQALLLNGLQVSSARRPV